MKKSVSRTVAMALAACMTVGTLAACGSSSSSSPAESTPASSAATSTESGTPDYSSEDPLNIRIYLSDNATLPYKEDWLTFTEVQKRCNVKLDVEAIPIADYSTKVSLALNTGENVPDVILYQTTTGENASLALNGALVPISDYSDWTPNFNARVEEMGLQDDVNQLNLQDGKRYYMPSLTDKSFYDGGLILREDYLEEKGFDAPKTFDDLYEILKAYKQDHPDSYPLTILAGPRVLFRMTMPSYGISVGKNSADGSYVLSYDYANKEHFAGAIDDKAKQYFAFLSKLYAEGLLDPEMADPIDGDKWSQKMATGASMATYAYYDQIVVLRLPLRSMASSCRCMLRWKALEAHITSPRAVPVPASCSLQRPLSAMISSALSVPSMRCSTLRKTQSCGALVLRARPTPWTATRSSTLMRSPTVLTASTSPCSSSTAVALMLPRWSGSTHVRCPSTMRTTPRSTLRLPLCPMPSSLCPRRRSLMI